MFERFSKEARAAVVGAQLVARRAGSRSIDTRHVLVALAEADGPAAHALRTVGVDPAGLATRLHDDLRRGGLDPEALATLGVDLDAVRARADVVFGRGALERGTGRVPRGHIPFTPDAKKALELALREVVRLGASTIDGGHLLLGILRATGSPAEVVLRRTLAAAGSDPAALRAAVEVPERRAS
jgi:ATP-dependent Clp protease ATP-binding subunit ClpA